MPRSDALTALLPVIEAFNTGSHCRRTSSKPKALAEPVAHLVSPSCPCDLSGAGSHGQQLATRRLTERISLQRWNHSERRPLRHVIQPSSPTCQSRQTDTLQGTRSEACPTRSLAETRYLCRINELRPLAPGLRASRMARLIYQKHCGRGRFPACPHDASLLTICYPIPAREQAATA
jgi:hypothetical protein